MFSPTCPPNLLHPSDQPHTCATRVEDRPLGSAPTLANPSVTCGGSFEAGTNRPAAGVADISETRPPWGTALASAGAAPPSRSDCSVGRRQLALLCSPDWTAARRGRTPRHIWTGACPLCASPLLGLVELGTSRPGSTVEPLPARRLVAIPCVPRLGVSEGSTVGISSTNDDCHVRKGPASRGANHTDTGQSAGHRTLLPVARATITSIVRPQMADMSSQGKDNTVPMSRSGLGTLPLLEGIEHIHLLTARIVEDGVITAEECRQMERALKSLRRRAERLHDSLAFIDRALHGNGIYGDWFVQKRKENVRDRLYLVRSEDDDPGAIGSVTSESGLIGGHLTKPREPNSSQRFRRILPDASNDH